MSRKNQSPVLKTSGITKPVVIINNDIPFNIEKKISRRPVAAEEYLWRNWKIMEKIPKIN
jgi:hypothetical protein